MIVTSHACRNIYMKITIVSYCGFLEHLSITFTDKTDLSDPLNREDYQRQSLCTIEINGLNREDSV